MFNKLALYIIGTMLIVGVVGGLYTKIQMLKNEVLTVSIERDNLKAAVKVKQLEIDNSKETQKTLEGLIVKEKEASQQLEKDLEEIRNEPESDNGSVGGILKRSIDSLHDDN